MDAYILPIKFVVQPSSVPLFSIPICLLPVELVKIFFFFHKTGGAKNLGKGVFGNAFTNGVGFIGKKI